MTQNRIREVGTEPTDWAAQLLCEHPQGCECTVRAQLEPSAGGQY